LSSSTLGIRWRKLLGIEFLWHSWGDEHVVFNTGSGAAHLLNVVEAEALHCLEGSERSCSELVDDVAEALDIGDAKDNLERYLQELLAQFQDVGLIESLKS
jgi:PqqD family protein of HPr-rel-A system